MAGFRKQCLVHDDAEALIAVTDRAELSRCVIQIVGVGIQLFRYSGVFEIIAIITPGFHCFRIAYDEQCRRLALIHLGGQRGLIFAGGCSNDLHINTGLLLILCSYLLQSSVRFRFEVQPINRPFALCFCTGTERKNHSQ